MLPSEWALSPKLRTAGYIIDRIEFVTQNGTRKSYLGANVFKRALGERFLSIQRGDLADAIYRTIENGVETIFGDSIVEIRQSGDAVEVTFERGKPAHFRSGNRSRRPPFSGPHCAFGSRENFSAIWVITRRPLLRRIIRGAPNTPT